MTEGEADGAGLFHKIPRIDDSRPAELFACEVLGFLVGQELLSPEWAQRLLSWRHTGFNVHRWTYICNYNRPNQALDYLTPAEYYQTWLESQRPKRH